MNRDLQIRSLLLLVLFISPFFMAITDSSVWDANEAFYVETPREMVESGEWIVPHFNGNLRLNKPPLSYWLVGIFYKFFGIGLIWERLLMALLAGGSVIAVFSIGSCLYNPRTALLGAGIFATSFRFLIVSRRLLIDSLVLCCALAGIALFLYWMKSRRNYLCLASAFFFGLGFLAKGPVALFPFLFLGIYCLLPGNRNCLGRIPWTASALILLGTSFSWFIALGLTHGWEPVSSFIFSENIGRFTSEDFGPRRGIFYYAGVFLADFFPWSLPFIGFSAAGLWEMGGRLKKGTLKSFKTAGIQESTIFLACWCLAYFLIFSLSHNKQEYYILPMYPAASLLLASAASVKGRMIEISFAASGIIVLVIPILIWFMNREIFPEDSAAWWLPAAASVIAGICLFRRQLLLAILGMVLFYQTAFFSFSVPLEAYKPVAAMAETIRKNAVTTDYELGYYRFTAPSLRFYSDRDIHEIYKLDRAVELLLSSSEAYLITDQAGLRELQENTGNRLIILSEGKKISSRLRTLLARLKNQASRENAWSTPVYLVTNRRSFKIQEKRFKIK
jgi:4-amino-4-deoxy-L-arabinose transferase-like glycosyltransferase